MRYFQLKTGYRKYGQDTTSTVFGPAPDESRPGFRTFPEQKVLLPMNPVLVTVRFGKNKKSG